MRAGARLALFAGALVAAGLLGAGVGAVVGPIDVGGSHSPAPTIVPGPDQQPDHGGHGSGGGAGHDLDEPFEVPAIGPGEDGS